MGLIEKLNNISDKKFIFFMAVIFLLIVMGTTITIGNVSISSNKEAILKATTAVQANAEQRRDLIDDWEKEQLIKLDAIFAAMRNLFQKTHRELLLSKGILNPFEHNQYKAYCHIIEIGFNEMRYIALDDFKNMITLFTDPENTEFTFAMIADEFADYIGLTPPEGLTGIKEKLIFEFGAIVRREWIDLGVTADENFDWAQQIVVDTCKYIEQVYKDAVCIQLSYQKRIKANQDELKEYINTL